jgi:hypothetical protein
MPIGEDWSVESPGRSQGALLAAVGAIVLACGSAAEASPPAASAGMSESELRAYEIATLGPEHAAEHAEMRAQLRGEEGAWEKLAPAQRAKRAHRERRAARRYAARTAGKRAKVGAWTQAPYELPNYAINAVLLPTGKVLFWGPPPGLEDAPNTAEVSLWDPALGRGEDAFESVPAPVVDPDGDGPQGPVAAPIYCSGQSLMASGEVLVTGGNLLWPSQAEDYETFAGLDRTFTFDPFTETWAEQPRMAHGRWYPSQVLLGDGRTVIAGGYDEDEPGGQFTDDVEIFDPGAAPGDTGSLELLDSAPRFTSLYPHLFSLPGGEVLLGGPGPGDSALLHVPPRFGDSLAFWQDLPGSGDYRIGSTAVLALSGQDAQHAEVTQLGGWGNTEDEEHFHPATSTTTTLDADLPGDGWNPGPSMKLGRSYLNTVVLPDRSMVSLGGGIGLTTANENFAVDEQGTRRRVEIFDPAKSHWRLGPAQLEDRAYHSTAVLLPDGRVWSAGDNFHGPDPGPNGFSSTDTAEIYSPPYLFAGTRPRIDEAPSALGWDEAFDVEVGRKPARRAVLVAPGATTHASDMSQRLIPLDVNHHDEHRLRARSPLDPDTAPPGHYMLFVLSKAGVPSVASWVRLEPGS